MEIKIERHGFFLYSEEDVVHLSIGNHCTVEDIYREYRTGSLWKMYEIRAIRDVFPDCEVIRNGINSYDVHAKRINKKYEIRSVTTSVHFTKSTDHKFRGEYLPEDLEEKLETVHGFLIVDVLLFPAVEWWYLSTVEVRKLLEKGILNKKGLTSRARFYTAIEYLTGLSLDVYK